MSNRLVDKLADTGNVYPQDEWRDFEKAYFNKLGFGGDYLRVPLLSLHIHPSISGQMTDPNWLHFLPSDTVSRLRSAEGLNKELPTIVDETYDRVVSELDLNLSPLNDAMSTHPGIDPPSEAAAQLKGVLFAKIFRQLRGNVDLEKIHGDVEFPTESQNTPTDDGIDVLVTCHSKRNFQNIEIYSVENPDKFFDTAFGDDTYMFEKLRQSNVQPEFAVENVAFEIEGHSWYQSNTPQDSIVYKYTDQKGRVNFYKIENPSSLFGDSWGDIKTMREVLNEDEGRHVGYSSGDWHMLAGMCS